MSSLSDRQFFRVAEAAEFLRVSIPTIRKWKRLGKLQARQVGRVILFDRADLLRLIAPKSP